MKRFFLIPFAVYSLLQLAGIASPAAAQQRKKKTTTSRSKKLPYKAKVPGVDPTVGDNVDGDDLTIRRAAVNALGTFAGSVVVVDPTNGRILSMVNQRLALKTGFVPCSTIKLVTSLAALTEGLVSKNTAIYTSRYVSYNMTQALARSNNQYFHILGTRLGYDRVRHYAEMLGLGEKAGLDIPGEQPGYFPDSAKIGGVGLMTSFGTGISMTPLELAALLGAIANGGTLYYLQYPRTQEEVEHFAPRIKHPLQLAPTGIEDIKMGMRGAVDFGTARRAGYDSTEPILGKTGTCTDFQTASHMGWFGSFNEVGAHRLVVVVMLTGGRNVSGPIAAGVAGAIYRNLSAQHYFVADITPAKKRSDLPDIITTMPCCGTGH
ncbi:MAG: penicillin-binding protein transpeptidase [Candidatus Solibacter sp.]|jgi:penicillin-binding protein 2|nr:penicillin-binding protein transpeptidase [Candidatus Solibacter sp.]